jgi:ERCC4-type nuclease
MKIIFDEREASLYGKCLELTVPGSLVLSKQVLILGDILIKNDDDIDILLIERKSLADLLASIKDGRYEEQSYRLINASGFHPHNVVYLIEGMFSQLRGPADKKMVISAITSLNYFKGFSAIRTSSLGETAEMVLGLADKIDRDLKKGKMGANFNLAQCVEPVLEPGLETLTNSVVPPMQVQPYCTVVKKVKKDNVTPENIGEIILSQIPGISSVTAIAIMKNFTSFPHFIEEIKKNPACLENMTCDNSGKSRKISKTIIQNIQLYLGPSSHSN